MALKMKKKYSLEGLFRDSRNMVMNSNVLTLLHCVIIFWNCGKGLTKEIFVYSTFSSMVKNS